MEPIFNDGQFDRNHGVIDDCSLFHLGTEYFFSHPKNRTLNNACYHFGLLFRSNHYKESQQWHSPKTKPIADFFKGVISTELLIAVQMGADDNGYYDEKESDKFDSYHWGITKAIEYNRPDWAFFLFLGYLQGTFNGDRILASRYVEYLNLFPGQFMTKYQANIIVLFDFFDERGFKLSIDLGKPGTENFTLKKVSKGLYFD